MFCIMFVDYSFLFPKVKTYKNRSSSTRVSRQYSGTFSVANCVQCKTNGSENGSYSMWVDRACGIGLCSRSFCAFLLR